MRVRGWQRAVSVKELASPRRRGQALVEFALVAFVTYLLLAAILTFGHALFAAQGLQQAAEVGARELSRTSLPANQTFEDALQSDEVRASLYDEAWLVVDLDIFFAANPGGNVFRDLVPQMPLLNQQLAPLMIVDRPDLDNDGTADAKLLRYPGALLQRAVPIAAPAGVTYPGSVAAGYAVAIPVVVSRSVAGAETIRWVAVVEEVDTEESPLDETLPNPDPFLLSQAVTGAMDHGGIAALRVNYPFQSAVMAGFRPNSAGPFEPTLGQPLPADDNSVTELNPGSRPGNLTGASLESGGRYSGAYGGRYGLGSLGAMGSQLLTGGRPVRPFRRVISAQSIHRRELFE
jgi:hypothetical protein